MAGPTGISWGRTAWCGTVVRHTGMFAVTSKMYPLRFLKEMYDLDEAAKRECGIWDAEHSPQHDSYVTRDLAIKEEYFIFYNPYDDEDVGRLRKWMGMVAQFSNERGVVWTAPTLSTKGPVPYQPAGQPLRCRQRDQAVGRSEQYSESRRAVLNSFKVQGFKVQAETRCA